MKTYQIPKASNFLTPQACKFKRQKYEKKSITRHFLTQNLHRLPR